MESPSPIAAPMPVPGAAGNPRKTLIISIGAVVVLVIILAVGYHFLHGKKDFTGNAPAFAVSIGPAPASPLYAIDHASGMLKPVTVMVGGVALPALDAIKTSDGSWYYILAERSSTPVGNLYMKKADGTVTALTTSKTAKYNLSYDVQSGRLAYQALTFTNDRDFATNQRWDLVIYDSATKKEMVVGKGMDPHIVTGGQTLIYRDGGTLNVEVLGTHATSTIANLQQGSTVFAVNAKNTALSMYNPITHAIDMFAITHGASLDYVSSTKVSVPPVSMGYAGDALIAAYVSRTASSTYYAFSRPDLSGLNAITVPGLSSQAPQIPQRLYTYE